MSPITDLDDLKTAWQTLNRNLERQHALTLEQFKESKLTRFRSRLRPLLVGQTIQIICGALLALLAASFCVEHIGTIHLMIYGLLLHGYGLMLIGFAVYDIVLINRIDYATPVVTIQKQLAALRGWHLRTTVWLAIAGSFIWVPLMLVIFYWLGADLWAKEPQVVYWFILNIFFCVGFIALSYGLIRYARWPWQSKLAKYFQHTSAGRSVNRAQAVLEEIQRFERD